MGNRGTSEAAADAVVASYSWVVLLGVVGDVSPFFAVFGSLSGRRQQTSLMPDLRIGLKSGH